MSQPLYLITLIIQRRRGLQIMKLLIAYFSQSSAYLLTRQTLSRNPILKHPYFSSYFRVRDQVPFPYETKGGSRVMCIEILTFLERRRDKSLLTWLITRKLICIRDKTTLNKNRHPQIRANEVAYTNWKPIHLSHQATATLLYIKQNTTTLRKSESNFIFL
jgi:hypothetical protein